VAVSAVLGFLLAWEAICRLGMVSPVLLTPPTRVATAAFHLLLTPTIHRDLAFTVSVYLVSLAVATIVGSSTGFLMGYSASVYQVINPFVVALNSMPKIILMPLIVLWLGIGVSTNLCLGALMAGFPIAIATYTGVRSLEQDFVLLAKSFGAGTLTTLRSIVLPGVAPFVVSGLRVGLNYAMVGVLTAEFFASSQGIGYRMVLFISNFEVESFFGCMALVVGFTLACTAAVARLEHALQNWRPVALDMGRGHGL
jgi:NitT/TauT family transport system permease protein